MRRAIRVVALLLSLCTSILLPANVAAASGVPQAVLDMRGSVVRVICQYSDGYSLGSAFAVGKDSVEYIVTNYHVVEGNPNQITVLRGDNRQITAKPFVSLPDRDLCVLKLSVPQYDIQPFELFDEEQAHVGEAVYTLGFPAAADVLSGTYTGEPGNVTVTSGIVSALKSWAIREADTKVGIVQIDAPISPGNSGGPLVNEHGQVLGVNTLTMLLESQNINGAVSILELTDALINNGIPYISASAPKAGNDAFPIYLTAGICLFVVAAAVLLFAIPRGKKKGIKGKSVSLAEYLRQWGGRLPYDMAIRVLEPALRELAFMHAQGRYHTDICPDNIFVSGNRAYLRRPDGKSGSNRVILRPGYSPPEQFRADGRLGPWSDVYSICAVIFFMVTGANPPGAVERQMAGGEGGFGFGGANINDAQAAAVCSGLMLDAAKRPQNCVELLAALGLPLHYTQEPAMDSVSSTVHIPASAKGAKERMGAGRRAVIIAASVLLALCAGAVGFYFYEDGCYNNAVAQIQAQDYESGLGNLSRVLSIFKDSGKWMSYARAGSAMQGNRFDEARAGFRALGDFYDARTMIREVSYQEALYLIDKGDYGRAKELFISLGDYSDSQQMVFETDYQKALSKLQNKEFDNAEAVIKELARYKYKDSEQMILEVKYQRARYQLQQKNFIRAIAGFKELAYSDYKDSKLMLKEAKYQQAIYLVDINYDIIFTYNKFKEMEPYKDSDRYLSIVIEKIYNLGIALYRKNDFSSSRGYFNLIASYERSNDYIVLINAHNILNYPKASSKKQVMTSYNAVKAFGDFEDAVSVSNALKKLLSKK